MNVSVENLGACKCLLRVEVDVEAVQAEVESATREVMRHATLPGFRPGKAPRAIVEKTFADRIDAEVKRKLLQGSFRKAITQEKLRPIGTPQVEESPWERGQPFSYTATFETEPPFELPDYKALPIRRDSRVVSEEDVTRALEMLRDQKATYLDVARPAQAGDFVVVNYSGTCEGKPIAELAPTAKGLAEKKSFWIHLQPGSFIPGFTEQLIGASAGESRTVAVTFPADFVVRELAGKMGTYQVEVTGVKEKALPAMDDSLARLFGAEDFEKLKAGVRADLENELKHKQKRQVRDQLVATLLGRVSCELPESLVQHETRSAVYDIVRANQERGVPKEAIDERKDEIYSVANSSAKERVKAMMVLARIAEAEGITATNDEILQRILQLAAQYRIPPQKLIKQLKERGAIPQIQREIVEAKVLDALELYAAVEEAPGAP